MNTRLGYGITLTGHVITILSFLFIPFLSVQILGFEFASYTLFQLLNLSITYSKLLGQPVIANSFTIPIASECYYLWIPTVIVPTITIVSIVLLSSQNYNNLITTILIISLSCISAGIFLYLTATIPTVSPLITQGPSGWICFFGQIVAATGGIASIQRQQRKVRTWRNTL